MPKKKNKKKKTNSPYPSLSFVFQQQKFFFSAMIPFEMFKKTTTTTIQKQAVPVVVGSGVQQPFSNGNRDVAHSERLAISLLAMFLNSTFRKQQLAN